MPKVIDAHRAERRRQILDGARRAFARYGYEGATVARLEEEIGLSRGAIFSYFPDKWSIFYALAVDDYDRFGRLWLDEGYGSVVRRICDREPGLARRLPRADQQAPDRRRACTSSGRSETRR